MKRKDINVKVEAQKLTVPEIVKEYLKRRKGGDSYGKRNL